MKPEEKIEKLVCEHGISPRPEWLEQTKTDMLKTFQQAEPATQPAGSQWRMIMKNKTTRATAAAVIIAAVLIGMSFFNTNAVVWADVIKPVLEAISVEYDAVIDESGENPQRIHEVVAGTYIKRTYTEGPVNEVLIDTNKEMLFFLVPEAKTAVSIYFKNLPKKLNLIGQARDMILELQNTPDFQVQTLDTDTIDGQPAAGFLANHPQKELLIWANPKTAIPFRIDFKSDIAADVTCRNFKFDSEIPQSTMEMKIPAGYVHQQHTIDLAGLPEAELIKALRFYAKFNNGLFPKDISVLHCIQPGEDIQRRITTLTPHDQKALRLLMQMTRQLLLLQYYQGPGQWHWIGADVELGDAQTPIYWYQPVNASTYRVIYGDLHVEQIDNINLLK